jgi:hypothetical protein
MVSGKIAKIALVNQETITSEDITHIVTTGKEESSMADDNRYRLLIRAIQSPKELFQSPFLRLIWYNPDPNTLPWPRAIHPRPEEPFEVDFLHRTLNKSQEDAANVALLLNNENRITILIGPPGSGLGFIYPSIFYTNNYLQERPLLLLPLWILLFKRLGERPSGLLPNQTLLSRI